MPHAITLHAVSHHAPAVILLNLACGVCGVPALAEALLIVSGALANGGASVAAPFAAAVIGSAIGMSMSFCAGRRISAWAPGGVVSRRCGPAMQRAAARMARFGPWTLVFGYFTPGVRHVAAAAAGAAGMHARRFLAFTVGGASLWSALLLLTGRISGDIRSAASAAHQWYLVGAGVAIAVALIALARAFAASLSLRLARRGRSIEMKRLVLVVAAVVLFGSNAFAATRPAHPSTVRVRRPRVAAAMAVHVHPFGHAAVHPILPHRTSPRSAKSSDRPAVPHTTVRLKPPRSASVRAATSRSSKR
jgi:membrane protein DedA with SNARE-associated domain